MMPPNDRIDLEQRAEDWELFLMGMRYRGSRLEKLSGNKPFLLSGGDNAWLIHTGMVDVFAVQTADGEPVGARHHFFRAQRYHLLLGQDLAAHDVGLLAVCAPETEILSFKVERLQQQLEKPENVPIITDLLETWVRALASGLRSDVRPKEFKRVQAGEPLTMQAGDIARAGREVLWVRPMDGRSRFMGRQDHDPVGDRLLPVSDRAWIQAADDCALHATTTSDLLQQGSAWDHVQQFDTLLLELVANDIERGKTTTSQMIREKVTSDEQRLDSAMRQLAATWDTRLTQGMISMDSTDPLLTACDLVGRAMGITIKSPPDYDGTGAYTDSLVAIARASRIRTRLVLLRDDWWQRDNGPLLAYRTVGDDRHPVALIPAKPGHYELHDPLTREVLPVNDTLADQISSTGYTFYRPFPNRPLNAWDLIRFGHRGLAQDMLNLLLVGAVGGLLGLVVPVITGILFDSIIPSGDTNQLLVLGGVLAVSAIAMLLFQIARGITLLRIEGRMDSAIHAALWDRVLNLPTDFFRKYSAGDLTERTIGLLTIKQVLSGSVPLAVLTGVFSTSNLLVMFVYDAQLALIALGIVTLSVVIAVLLGLRFLRFQRDVARQRGELSGIIAQLVGGISKLRVAGAENRAFYLWANAFSEQKKLAFRAQSVRNMMAVFYAVYPTFAAMMIYAAVYERTTLSTGAFLAFNAAFVAFLAAALQLGAALVTVLSVVPLYERLQPILQLRAEVDEQKAHPGELTGAIEVNHVSFRYHKDGPLILDDVTFSIEPGEFVALVGASGSGKSTLLRHLLGFETPDSGAVYYDGQALAEVDLRAVRRQIGVVLQHSQVITGTILDNITGSTGLTVDDAWAAVRQAGIEDDIKQMPMGMQTYISEGGSTFSGGQRQRLLIARALVTHPRIIFFDEATSALDDKTQSQVTESLKQVDATRIIIAHRLSTIVDADRILVMEHGRIVEQGTYKELMERRGAFARLAERQLI